MIIALDYDDTFTRDPDGWVVAMELLKKYGHRIIGATMRSEKETSDIDQKYLDLCDVVIYTNRHGKRKFLEKMRIFPHVWIDDTPEFIAMDAFDV